MYTIYVLKEPITKEVRYVGQTKGSAAFRFQQHLKEVKADSLKCSWIEELSKKGLQPELEAVMQVESKLEANYAEYVLITYHLHNGNSGLLNIQNTRGVVTSSYNKESEPYISEALAWIKSNKKVLKIRKIEEDLKMPEGTLNKYLQQGRSIAPLWGFKIAEWVKDFNA